MRACLCGGGGPRPSHADAAREPAAREAIAKSTANTSNVVADSGSPAARDSVRNRTQKISIGTADANCQESDSGTDVDITGDFLGGLICGGSREDSAESSRSRSSADENMNSPSVLEASPKSDGKGVDPKEKSAKVDFSGKWTLEKTEGNFDDFLSDMGQGWFLRTAARAIKYGVGRVNIKCQHSGDTLDLIKLLADPLKGESHIPVRVGEGLLRYRDDIGDVTCSSSCWEGRSLRFNGTLDDSKLSVTMLMYFDDDGNFVEEMTSCKNTRVKYIFTREN